MLSPPRPGPGWEVRTLTTEAGHIEAGRRRRLPSGAVLDVIGSSAWVEASAPKARDGHNLSGLAPADARLQASAWLLEAAQWVDLDPDDVGRVTRLDVVRDFDLEDPGRVHLVLGGLACLPVDGRQHRKAYADPTRGGAQTVWIGTRRAGGGRCYDKGRESGALEAAGRLRFEGEERTRALGRAGIRRLEDVTPEAAERAARLRWEVCGFGRPFDALAGAVGAVMGHSGLTEGQRLAALGYLTLLDTGWIGRLERSRDYRLRRILRGLPVPSRGHGEAWRLDFDRGLVAA